MRILSLVCTFLMIYSGSVFADIFSCVADSATGFQYNKADNAWKPALFNVAGKKYLISPVKLHPGAQAIGLKRPVYEVLVPGRLDPVAFCHSDFNNIGGLFCQGSSKEFIFNKANGRYIILWSKSGYVNQGIKIPFTKSFPEANQEMQEIVDDHRKELQKEWDEAMPYMEIGKCTPF